MIQFLKRVFQLWAIYNNVYISGLRTKNVIKDYNSLHPNYLDRYNFIVSIDKYDNNIFYKDNNILILLSVFGKKMS